MTKAPSLAFLCIQSLKIQLLQSNCCRYSLYSNKALRFLLRQFDSKYADFEFGFCCIIPGDYPIPDLYELPSELLDAVIAHLPALALQNFQTNM